MTRFWWNCCGLGMGRDREINYSPGSNTDRTRIRMVAQMFLLRRCSMRFAYVSLVALLMAFGSVRGEPPRAISAARPDEAVAKTFSIQKGAEFLDAVTLSWVRSNQCFSCHTGYPYLLARTSV